MYKPVIRKDVILKGMNDTTVMESILFNPENDGFFRESSTARPIDKLKYVNFLLKASIRWGRWSIWFEGNEVGFIMTAGPDCRLVGGIKSEYQRRGIYGAARQAVIKAMNDAGQFSITSSYQEGNIKMARLNEGVPTTPVSDSLVINHFDPMQSVAVMESPVDINPTKVVPTLYHISFDDNLPKTLSPKLPDGRKGEPSKYTEKELARVSFAPSVELCFRAVYANVSKLLEGTDENEITFTVYMATPKSLSGILTPVRLHDKRLVHDAFITQEHAFVKDIGIKKMGKVTFMNTSDDEGLRYLPFNEDEPLYHSPLNIITKK